MTSETLTPTGAGHADEPIIRLRHPGRWIAAAILAVLVAMFVHFVATAPRLRLDLVAGYLFEKSILRGPLLRAVSGGYVWLFRGTPILVQLLFWFFLGTVLPQISIGVPFGPSFASVPTNTLITQFTAAILGLGLNEAAYMAEIVRAGIGSVDRGQTEAAHALGFSPRQTMQRIVLPQAMRVIVPPTGNETITMLKNTSLVAVIAAQDLLTRAQAIYSRTFEVVELLIVVSIWYLLVTTVASIGQHHLERRFAR